MKLEWYEINDENLGVYYSLKDNNNREIAYMWFFNKCWSLTPVLYKDTISKKVYFNYKETEIEDVKFRAVLDIMSDLNNIANECYEYSNAISDYITEYLIKINKDNNNED